MENDIKEKPSKEDEKKLAFASRYGTPVEKLKALYDRYKNSNWGYTGVEEKVHLGKKTLYLMKYPSGDTYVKVNGTTLEKLTPTWFEKMKQRIKEEENE